MNKKICLINLPSPYLKISKWSLPNSLIYLQAFLNEKKIQADILDLADEYEADFLRKIPLNYEYYGITVYTPQHYIFINTCEYIKKNSDAIVFGGGRHLTYEGMRLMKQSKADFIIKGEGEEIVYEIVSGKKPDKINGIYFRKGKQIIENRDRSLIQNLDILPIPKIDGFNLDEYPGNKGIRGISNYKIGVIFSRGCYGKCAFCISPDFWKGCIRFHRYEWIKKYIEYLVEIGIHQIMINDDNFLIHPDFDQITNLLKVHGIKYQCMTNANDVTEEKAIILSESGCYKISLGIESGSDKLLKKMNKISSNAMNKHAIKILKGQGIFVEGFLMIGFPNETWLDIIKTGIFIKKNECDIYNISTFVPYPGCDVWKNPRKYTKKKPRLDYSKYLHLGKELEIESCFFRKTTMRWRREYLSKMLDEKDVIKKKLILQ